MNQKCIDFYCRMAIRQLELLRSRVDSGSLEEYIPENENDFLAVLREALESGEKVQEFRVRGMERAARFTWERTAADVLALYQKIGDRKVN